MTLEDRIKEWLKQPGTAVMPGESQFIADMRKAARHGVGYGWMQQVAEWEWQSKFPAGAWGPEYFGKKIDELSAGWQLIETAPKVRDILLWGKYWSDSQGDMSGPMIGRWWNDRWEVWSHGGPFGVRPTIWRDLPGLPRKPPPADREAGVDEILKEYSGYINEHPELVSVLYDIDMLPEQTTTYPGALRVAAFCEVWKRYEAAKAETAPSGWKLLPVEQTKEMAHALESNIAECLPPSEVHVANWRDAYAAMLAVAPTPPPGLSPKTAGAEDRGQVPTKLYGVDASGKLFLSGPMSADEVSRVTLAVDAALASPPGLASSGAKEEMNAINAMLLHRAQVLRGIGAHSAADQLQMAADSICSGEHHRAAAPSHTDANGVATPRVLDEPWKD